MNEEAHAPSHKVRRVIRWIVIALLAVWIVRLLLLLTRT